MNRYILIGAGVWAVLAVVAVAVAHAAYVPHSPYDPNTAPPLRAGAPGWHR